MSALAARLVRPSRGDASQDLVRAHRLERRSGTGERARTAVMATDVAVRSGERIAVTGPSGSGKSTLLHLLAGLDTPTSGTVSWPGLGADGVHPLSRPGRVGVVFQAPSVLPALDVVENVELVPLVAGVEPDEARSRAWAALRSLDLADLTPALPEELSGGQAQRVVIARVLAGDPLLVLADEPTGQLDHTTAAHVLDVLEAAVEVGGAALLVATHDTAVAGRYPLRWSMADGALTVDAVRAGATPEDEQVSR